MLTSNLLKKINRSLSLRQGQIRKSRIAINANQKLSLNNNNRFNLGQRRGEMPKLNSNSVKPAKCSIRRAKPLKLFNNKKTCRRHALRDLLMTKRLKFYAALVGKTARNKNRRKSNLIKTW